MNNRVRFNRKAIQALVPLGLAFLLTACFMPVPQPSNTVSSETARVPYLTATSSPVASPTESPTAQPAGASLVGDISDANVGPAATPTLNVWAIGSPAPTNTVEPLVTPSSVALSSTMTVIRIFGLGVRVRISFLKMTGREISKSIKLTGFGAESTQLNVPG